MDLSALLAREGIQADDADALVAWARQRAAALVMRIEPGSALAHQLGLALEQARGGEAAIAADVPVPLPRQSSRSAPRSIGRAVSSPHLGAAVQAALTRNEPALEKALETAELEISAPEEPAPAPEPEPEPAPVVADDEDASIGGFNRFAFSLRRRVIETNTSPVEQPPAPVHEPEPAAEESSDSAAIWQAIDLELPAPPGFETGPDQDVPVDRSDDAEHSGGLVVGIPDDDSIDIPVPRPRPRSDGRSVASSALPSAAPSGPHPEAQAARSSEALELDSATLALDGLDLDLPDPPPREISRPQPTGRPNSNAYRAATPPPPPRSGPHRAASGPLPAPSSSGPQPASDPQSPTSSAVQATGPQKFPTPRRSKTATGEQKPVAKPVSEPKAAASKKAGKGRKKVVELVAPVTAPVAAAPAVIAGVTPRKASIGNHLPTGEPSSPGHRVPAYLQDDDE